MTRRIAVDLLLGNITLGAVALECTSAPRAQCQDGSTKVQHHKGKPTQYHCSNGEWIKEPVGTRH